MKNYKNIIISIFLASVTFVSCSDIFDVKPEEVLLKEDYLGDDKLDARAAVFGVLSLMQDVAEQNFIWGEMRADLVDVTEETEDELRQIAMHENSEENSYLDPTLLFSVVNNCNYGMAGIDTVAYDNALLDEYVALLRLRTWAQLQIAINFGQLPFLTEPIESTEDLDTKYPLLELEEAMFVLANELLPYNDVEIEIGDNIGSEGGYPNSMIPDSDVLLGELYLWAGDYNSSAIFYKKYLDKVVTSSSSAYNLNTDYNIEHTENNGNYTTTLRWWNIFESSTAETVFNTVYTEDFKQFNNLYDNLEGQVKPSTAIQLNWSLQKNEYEGLEIYPGDFRASVMFENQYLDERTGEVAEGINAKLDVDFFKYDRVSRVYLRFAEAVNKAGYPTHALNIINKGVYNEPGVIPQFVDNSMTFLNFDPETYYTLNTSGVATSGNLGIRGRAGLAPVVVENATSKSDSIVAVEALILDEAALELAYEGTRWSDLIRSAKYNGDASIVADAVAAKFEVAGDAGTAEEVRSKLLLEENWYLPLTIPDNFLPVEYE